MGVGADATPPTHASAQTEAVSENATFKVRPYYTVVKNSNSLLGVTDHHLKAHDPFLSALTLQPLLFRRCPGRAKIRHTCGRFSLLHTAFKQQLDRSLDRLRIPNGAGV
jgi:hypothetical protein